MYSDSATGPRASDPLTPLQHGMLFDTLRAPHAGVAVEQVVCRLREPLRAGLLEEAWARVVERHDVLRTRFRWAGVPEPVQEAVPGARVPVQHHDCASLSPAGREAALEHWLADDRARGYDLSRAPATRLALFRFAPDEHVLVWSFHHILLDGRSVAHVLREAFTLYDAAVDGAPAALPQRRPFREHVAWLRGRDPAADEAYWTRTLGGMETPEPLSPARAAPRGEGEPPFAERELRLSPGATAALRAFEAEQGIWLNTLVQGAWALLLGRRTGHDEAVFGVVRSGRGGVEGADGMVGLLINTVPVRVPLPPAARVADWLAGMGEAGAALLPHEHAPLPDVVRWSGAPARAALFDTLLDYQPQPFDAPLRAGGRGEGRSFRILRHPGLPLALSVTGETPLRLRVNYDTARFDAAAVDRLLGQYARLLEALAACPDGLLGDLDPMGEEERRQVLLLGGSTAGTPGPALEPVHRMVERRAARTPHAAAVAWEGGSLPYGELHERAGRLAGQLLRRGVRPEEVVGVCLPRSADLAVAALAVLRAGGAYLPLDPAYPPGRLAYLLEDAGVRVLITRESLLDVLPAGVPALCLDRDADAPAAQPEDAPVPDDAAGVPERLAYLVYTSGSTGRPKGVMVSHGALSNLVRWHRDAFHLGPDDAATLVAGVGFDASVWEMWPALAAGATLHVVPDETRASPERLRDWLAACGATVSFLPTPVAEAVLPLPWPAPMRLRTLLTGGDRLRAHPPAGLPFTLVNNYGPSEAAVVATSGPVEPGRDGVPAIGRPIAGSTAYVLDGRTRPVPAGVAGELYVGGAGVARGYRGRPGATAERFLPDPFSAVPGARMYRTGDRVRWLAWGELAFLGRADEQIKIRGFRIEPGEVEAALRAQPGVREALVVAREDAPGDRRLVAYLRANGTAPDPAALRAALRAQLPEPLVPSAFVVLDAFPLTENGKVDRRALPAPTRDEGAGGCAPRTETERRVAEIWAQVLGVEEVGVDEDFFGMGGHSLLAMRVVSRIRDLLGVEVPLHALLNVPTVAALAGEVEALRGTAVRLPPIVSRARTEAPPLSFAQEQLWFLHGLNPGTPLYNVPAALRLSGALDVAALERALGEVLRRHEALRTTFAVVDDAPVQVIAPFTGFTLPVQALPGGEAALRRAAADEAVHPFDLAAGPLFRARLLRWSDEEHVLLVCIHHVATDGWSMGVLFRELAALYGAFSRAGESPLAPLPVQYADYAAWQREQMQGPGVEAQLAYWTARLAGAPARLELPADHPRPAVQTHRSVRRPVRLSAELVERLEALGRREGATLYMVLLGAFQCLLARYGNPDVVVGSPAAGRTHRQVEELIGLFVNMLVLRTELGGDPPFRQVLRRVRETVQGAWAHDAVPFERVVQALQPEGSRGHSPLFQVVFAMDGGGAPGALGDLRVEPVEIDVPTVKFDLVLTLSPHGRGLPGTLAASADRFDPATVERMAGHFVRVLEQVADDADVPVSRVELMGDDERRRVLEAWNRTERDYPRGETIHGLFARQAARTPDAAALVFGGERTTYAELHARAGRLAARLRALGVGPETRVAVCMERTPEMVAALLAVLTAGGAYVPVDPAYPAERIRGMLDDARVAVVLTQTRGAARIPDVGAAVLHVDDGEDAAGSVLPAREVEVLPENTAYVIYTSGSTGRPKGVQIEHRSATVLLHWLREQVPDEERRAVLCATSISFDVSIAEIFGTLCWGGTLHLVENALALAELPPETEILRATMVPSAAAELVRLGRMPASLRSLGLGGEAVPVSLARDLHALGTLERIENLYGPTEDTTYSTCWIIPRGTERMRVGRPVANTRAYVLEGWLAPVPQGAGGELYLAGDGLARGYLDRPALTAERFLPDPFGPAGSRMYRVGDRVRWTVEGELEYLGRLDHQVKVRGFRVEPGEVEEALRAHPAVQDAAVVARPAPEGGTRLVAYVAPAGLPAAALDAGELRAHLRGILPDYMIPARIVALEALPRTANGKTDRRALPDPDVPAAGAETHREPGTPTERRLAALWCALLGVERVGADDDFFMLGGHSLLATRLVARLQAELGASLPMHAVFEAPTLGELAARIDALPAAASLPARRRGREGGELATSFAQERLWFLDRMQPGSAVYNLPAARRLRGRLDADVLRRALAETVRRHEALRTAFPVEEGRPVQRILPALDLPLPVEDLSALPEADREAAVRARLAEEARRPFALDAPPLLRAVLLRTADDEHVLSLVMHHIVSDGWSLGILFRELAALYAAFARGEPSPLPELEIQYADYAGWQRGELAAGRMDAGLAWWREALRGAPALLELPTDRPRPAVQGHRGGSHRFALPAGTAAPLRALARAEGATPFMALLAVFAVLLHRWSGADDLVVGSPLAGRERPEAEPLIGFFVNTLPLRANLRGAPTFRALLRRVRETALGAFAHADVPFEKLVEALRPERSLAHAPLFQVVLALEDAPPAAPEMPGVAVDAAAVGTATAKFDLTLGLTEEAGGWAGVLSYAAELFDGDTAARMAEHFAALAAAAAAGPDRPVAALPMLSQAERGRVLRAWNATAAPFSLLPVHRQVEARVRECPGAPAVREGDAVLTRAELDARANRLAHRLRALGVGPEDRVGVCLPRSADLVTAVLAVLRAGGAYLPLDPAYPPGRLAYLLEDAGVRVLVTRETLLDVLPADVPALCLDRDAGALAAQPEDAPVPDDAADDPARLAYLVYTSGSTGRPKGVMVSHGALANLAGWHRDAFRLGPDDGATLIAGVGFDASVWETWPALAAGATLHVVGDETRASPEGLRDWLAGCGATVAFLPTPVAEAVLPLPWPRETRLRTLLTGGDRLRAHPPAGLPFVLVNNYGPTEAAVVATSGPVGPGSEGGPSIGRPIANGASYVLDGWMQPAPAGVPGELFVGGAGVARGYRGRPGTTAERFVPDPFCGVPGARMYRTGDRVRWLAGGEIEFLGRADDQVKIRGFRIEPGEVESALRAHPDVLEALVVAREDEHGDRRLVAYLRADGAAPDAASLRTALRAQMPEPMVPSAFVFLDAFPLTENGKVDRRALPAPARAETAGDSAPQTEMELRVAEVWAEVLGVGPVGVEVNFFDAGGHSLLLVRLHALLRERLDADLELVDLFRLPTVRDLAARLERPAGVDAAQAAAQQAEAARVAAGRGRLRTRRRHEKEHA